MKKYILLPGILLFSILVHAQRTTGIKFGDVNEKDFANTVYSIDSSAGAVIISDIGYSKIEGNNKGWFSLIFKKHRRIHILKKSGYELGDIAIRLYADNEDEEKLEKLRAVTYNLENGKVVETKLDLKSGVFKENLSKNWTVRKFTFPILKEGSIIEYEYTINSDFLRNLQPWEYQGAYPRLWSEYNVSVPDFLSYVFLRQGYKKYDIEERKDRFETFHVAVSDNSFSTDRYTINSNVSDYRWVMQNVKALKEENFTTTIDNHRARIEFQLSEYRRPLTEKKLFESWPKVASNLLESEYFGQTLARDNPWAKDITGPLKKQAPGKAELARKIYAWVRDNFECTSHDRFTMDQAPRTLVKSRKGTVAEINLLLAALLTQENIPAIPVILSTRENGKVYSFYPLMSQYNYVVILTLDGDKPVFLDASIPMLGFGHLPLRCYNGESRMIDANAQIAILSADSLTEAKQTTVFLVNDEKGNVVGSKIQTNGYYESMQLRQRIKEKGMDQLLQDIKKEMGSDYEVSNLTVDSLDNYDEFLGIKYDFDIKSEKEDIIYLNPMFGEGYKENIFKAAERSYPVEMPFTMDETYTLQMEIPQGYVVDELPKSMMLKLNEENEGFFEYRISQSGGNISFRSRIKLARANFLAEEYEMLREFFNYVVKKQAEQIVFKKKN